MNKLSIKEHTKMMKNITFLDAKWLLKNGTLQHDWLILFVPVLNLHCRLQCVCNPKAVK